MVKSKIRKICEKLTKHKFRKYLYGSDVVKEYYYECRICGEHFWNNNKPEIKEGI